MGRGEVPTTVAVLLLDVCEPIDDDCYAHRGLVHFLLDGHHKLNAGAPRAAAVGAVAGREPGHHTRA